MLSSANTENPFSWALTPPPTISSFAKTTELCLPGQLYISNFFSLSLVHKILPDFLGFSESWLTFGFGSCWTIDLHEFSFTVSPKVLVSNWGLAATPKTHFCGLCLPDFRTLPRSLFIPACLFQATLNWGKFSWCGSHILKPFTSLPSSRLRAQQKQIPLGMAWIKKLNRTGSERLPFLHLRCTSAVSLWEVLWTPSESCRFGGEPRVSMLQQVSTPCFLSTRQDPLCPPHSLFTLQEYGRRKKSLSVNYKASVVENSWIYEH